MILTIVFVFFLFFSTFIFLLTAATSQSGYTGSKEEFANESREIGSGRDFTHQNKPLGSLSRMTVFNPFSSRKRSVDGSSALLSSSSSDNDGDERNTSRQPQINDFYRDESYNPRKANDRLNLGLMSLSNEERNNVLEEVHGVRCMAPQETPNFIHQSLRGLEDELFRIPPSKKHAYTIAVGLSNTYVNSYEFRIRFLRCELYDTAKAAQRLVNFLDLITFKMPFYDHNGDTEHVLRDQITLSKFSEKEIDMYKKGHIQLLPFRDRSGRRVVTGVAQLGIRFDTAMWYKLALYTLLVAGEDTESQKKGIVMVVWPDPDIADTIKLRYPINNGGELFKAIIHSIPVRFAAIHFCTPANVPFFNVLKSVFTCTLSKEKRSRVRFHSGEPIELNYQIGGYGIPIDLLPITSTGNVKTTYLKQWIKLRIKIEKNIDTASRINQDIVLIECPGSLDVLFRPGKPVMNHIGNVSFRSLMEPMLDVHEKCTQTQKFEIVKQVVDELIQNRKGRFLTWDNSVGCWIPITDPQKQQRKVAVAFRNWKTHKKAQQNRQIMDESDMTRAFKSLDHNNDGNNPANVCQQIILCNSDDDTKRNSNKKRRRSSNAGGGM